ncbi:hypothetical protein Sjap_015068 [Stephania japonica]|uniref:Uncharacterized protein n=1 Tax=Stephania japonica TaxID=461633 RepID=A0AAP0IIF2_9MAGN
MGEKWRKVDDEEDDDEVHLNIQEDGRRGLTILRREKKMLRDAQRRSKVVEGKARRDAQRRRRLRCHGSSSQRRADARV